MAKSWLKGEWGHFYKTSKDDQTGTLKVSGKWKYSASSCHRNRPFNSTKFQLWWSEKAHNWMSELDFLLMLLWLCDWLNCTQTQTHTGTHTLCMLKPHAVSCQQRRYSSSSSQSIKPCYANCKIIISIPTSAEYPNSHSISRIIPLCSFFISSPSPLSFSYLSFLLFLRWHISLKQQFC